MLYAVVLVEISLSVRVGAEVFRKFIKRLRKRQARYIFESRIKRLTERDVCIDCGANMGEITSIFAASGAVVYAFEPDPLAFEHLVRRFSGARNVHLINAAVAAKSGKLPLYRSPAFQDDPIANSQRSSLIPEKRNVSIDNPVIVDVVNLLDFCRKLGTAVKIMKMDIEGSEVEILEALKQNEALLDQFDSIFVETHERKIPDTKERVDRIAKYYSSRKHPYVNLYWQ